MNHLTLCCRIPVIIFRTVCGAKYLFYVMAFQWIGFKKEENKAHLKDFWINGVNVFWTKVCHRLLACEALSH